MSENFATNVFNADQLNGLRVFFESTYSGDYSYRVYLAQKAINLNEIVFADAIRRAKEKDDHQEFNRLRDLRAKSFCSQTGITLMASRLAQNYESSKAFPNILIVDELVLTGFDYSRVVYELEAAICDEIAAQRQAPMDVNEYYDIREKLISAIDFRVYMIDHKGLLIENSLSKCIQEESSASSSECFAFAQTATVFVSKSDYVENTSFLPSFRLQANLWKTMCDELSRQEWTCSKPESCSNERQVWYRSKLPYGDYAAFSCRKTNDGLYVVTPYYLFRSVPPNNMSAFCELMSKCLESLGAYKLAKIFRLRDSTYKSEKIQLASTVLSILLFYCSFADSLNDKAIPNDFDKISQFYGFICVILDDFKEICAPNRKSERLNVFWTLTAFISRNCEALSINPSYDTLHGIDDYLSVAKKFFRELETNEHISKYHRYKKNLNYSPWSISVSENSAGLSSYLSSFPDNYTSFELKMTVILLFNQYGYTGMRASTNKEDVDDNLSDIYYLNVGESASAFLYDPIMPYLSVLQILEIWCKKKQLGAIDWLTGFGRYLDRIGKAPRGICLEELFKNSLSDIYKCGYKLTDWSTRFNQEISQSDLRVSKDDIIDYLNSVC